MKVFFKIVGYVYKLILISFCFFAFVVLLRIRSGRPLSSVLMSSNELMNNNIY